MFDRLDLHSLIDMSFDYGDLDCLCFIFYAFFSTLFPLDGNSLFLILVIGVLDCVVLRFSIDVLFDYSNSECLVFILIPSSQLSSLWMAIPCYLFSLLMCLIVLNHVF